ncbi:MAG TPA: hypothetical protein VIY51_10855 [Xanthobacteraceae bacterium]
MSDNAEYWVEVKHRYRLPKPYAWEICCSDHPLAVMRSDVSFKSEILARNSGETALKGLLQRLRGASAAS